MNLKFAFFILILFLIRSHNLIAQVYVGSLKSSINFQANEQNYVFSSDAVNFTLDKTSKRIDWYCKGATFSAFQDSQSQALLEKSFGFNSHPIISFNAPLPQKFVFPEIGKSVRVPITGILTVRGVKKRTEAVVEITQRKENPDELLIYFDLRQASTSNVQGFVFTIDNKIVSKRNF